MEAKSIKAHTISKQCRSYRSRVGSGGLLFWFLAGKISPRCFRLEGGAVGSRARLCWDRNGTAEPGGSRAEPWFTALPLYRDHPTRCFLLRPVRTRGDAEGPSQPRPRERQAGKGRPVFGMFSSLSLGSSPTHPHEHQEDMEWFIELFVRGSRRCRASPGPSARRGCRALPRHNAGNCVCSSLLRSSKAQTCSVQSPTGQGKPTTCCGKMAGTEAFPPAAVADCTGK